MPPIADKSKSENKKAAAAKSKQKPAKKTAEKPSLKPAYYHRLVAYEVAREPMGLPPFPHDYRIYPKNRGEEKGDIQIIDVSDAEVATKIKLSVVSRDIAKYVHRMPDENFHFADHEVDATARLWTKLRILSPVPAAFRFKSDKGLCFNRLPFDSEPGEDPHWRALFRGTQNLDALLAFIWSNFVPESYNQQYLYIKGDGGDGKGCLVRFLEKIFGPDMKVIQRPPSDDNKHFGMDFEEKRIVAFSDLRNPKFLQSDVVMGITGGDTLQVDPKGGTPYNVRPNCKLLFCSNKLPIIGSQHSERRRIIFAEMGVAAPVKPNRYFEDRLWEEGGAFLARCKEAYERLCPDHSMIPQDDDAIIRIHSFAEEEEGGAYQDFFEDNFVLHPIDPDLPKKQQHFVMATTMDERIKRFWGADRDRQGFRVWMKTVHGLTAEQKWFPISSMTAGAVSGASGGKNLKVYYRLGLKNSDLTGFNKTKS